MRTSEQIAELAGALSKAQGEGNCQNEGRLVNQMVRVIRGGNKGRRWSGVQERFFAQIAFGMSECWYWTGCLSSIGYGLCLALGENVAHRVSWVLHHGRIPDGLNVLHKCDVRNCVNPGHLFLGTHQENMRDMMAKGRWRGNPRKGEESAVAKLTADDVRKIRRLRLEHGISLQRIADEFGVSRSSVTNIISGYTWRTVQ